MEKKKSSAGGASASLSDRATTAGKSSKSRKDPKLSAEAQPVELNPEEEARLKAEQEERERIERERKIAEEKRNRERKIIELKNRELTPFYDFINELNFKCDKFHKERREKSKWLRYTRCDGSPDPVIPGEINTFLTLLLEDKLHNDIKNSLNNTNLTLDLIEELKFLIDDLKQDIEIDHSKTIEAYQKTIKDLESVIVKKFYETCYDVLLGASEKVDPETLNFDSSDGNEKLYYCIWANLSHNPKIKDFCFTNKSFTFVLPRQLTLANVAICCVFTSFDVYSSRSRTYACRIKQEKFEFEPIPDLSQLVEKQDSVMSAFKRGPTSASNASLKKDDLNESDSQKLDENPEAEEAEENGEKKEEEEAKPEEVKVEEVQKDENPSAKSALKTATIEETKKPNVPSDELAILQELSDSSVIDLRNYLPLGDIIHFGLFKVPPQPKKIKQWIITEKDNPQSLAIFEYPSDPSLIQYAWKEYLNKKQSGQESTTHNEELAETVRSTMNLTLKSTEILDTTANDTMISDNKLSKSLLSSDQMSKLAKLEGPIQINYKIQPNVFFGETPQLARWDEQRQHWRTDEIIDVKYTEETHEISFKTYQFPPFCLLQDRHIHMPFQLWRLAPRESPNNCMFTIESTNFELNIEIKMNEVRLYVPQRKAQPESAKKQAKPKVETVQRLDYESTNMNPRVAKVIEPIANKWFSLRKFIEVMRSIGLNIFPELDSEKFVTITAKDKKLERSVYRNMAFTSCVVSYGYSKWNAEINDESKIIVLEQVHMSNKEPNPDSFKSVVFTKELISLSNSQEMSEEFDYSIVEGTDEHADMYHMCMEELCKEMDKNAIDVRMKQIDELYFQTCLEFLESVKFLTFS